MGSVRSGMGFVPKTRGTEKEGQKESQREMSSTQREKSEQARERAPREKEKP